LPRFYLLQCVLLPQVCKTSLKDSFRNILTKQSFSAIMRLKEQTMKRGLLLAVIFSVFFVGCATQPVSSRQNVVRTVPRGITDDDPFNNAIRILETNYPDKNMVWQNPDLFRTQDIRQYTWRVLNIHRSLGVFLVNTARFPEYYAIFHVHSWNSPAGTSTTTHYFRWRIVRLENKEY